jgi:hypothetical protein
VSKTLKFVSLSVCAALVACGGDDGHDSKGPTDATLCAHICARLHEAACPGDANTDCQMVCLGEVASSPPACKAQLDAFGTCASTAKYTCDAQNEATPLACASQFQAWAACSAPGAADSGTPGVVPPVGDSGLVASADAGSTPTAADASSGDAGTAIAVGADAGKQESDAGLPDICQPDPNDDACETCGEQNCCPELDACDDACAALTTCIGNCDDSTCANTCVTTYPAGAVGFNALSTCYQARCATPCN